MNIGKAQVYKIALVLLLLSAVADQVWTNWPGPKHRPAPTDATPTQVIQQAFLCLKQKDFTGFTDYFAPEMRQQFQEHPEMFQEALAIVNDSDMEVLMEVLGETVEGDQASVKARYQIIMGDQRWPEEVIHTLLWDGKRWGIQVWQTLALKKAPTPKEEPKEKALGTG